MGRLGLMNCISFQGVKGGIGKTTTTTNIAHVCAMAGYKILVCDQDPQGSATELFGTYDSNNVKVKKWDIKNLGLYNLYLKDVDTKKYIFRTRYENIDIIPNARNVIGDTPFDAVFIKESGTLREKFCAFYKNLQKIKADYDYIFIDGYPTNGYITDVLLIASDFVVTPALADRYNINAIADIVAKIKSLDDTYGRDTLFAGYFFNQYQPPKDDKDAQDIEDVYKNTFDSIGIEKLETNVRFSKPVAQKSGFRKMLFVQYNKNSNPARDIISLAEELSLLSEYEDDKKTIKDVNFEIFQKNLKENNFGLRTDLVQDPKGEEEE